MGTLERAAIVDVGAALSGLRAEVRSWTDLDAVPAPLRSILCAPDRHASGVVEGDATGGGDGNPLDQAWHQFGDILFNRSDDGFLLAEQAYRLAIASASADFSAYRGLAECLCRRGRLAESRDANEAWFSHWIASAQTAELRRQQDAARERGLPAILIIAMQKSASEFIRDTLLAVLDMPLIYPNIGTIPVDLMMPSALRQLAKGGALSRCHSSAGENVAAVASAGIGKLLLHVRDPRQVAVSLTHALRKDSDAGMRYSSRMYDPPFPPGYRGWSLREQLDWSIAHYLPGQVAWLEGWAAALAAPPAVDIKLTTYEGFHRDPIGYFQDLLDFFAVPPIDVDRIREIDPSKARNFRKGQVDEWREVYSEAQAREAWRMMQGVAERFGWER